MMRWLAVLAVVALATRLSAAPQGAVDLGATNREAGLSVPSAGDGTNEPARAGGRDCRRVSGAQSLYLYVQVSERLFAPGDHTIYLTVDLFDDAPQLVTVQYDHVAAAPTLTTKYHPGPAMVLLGSGQWVRRTVRLDHARLGKGQNHRTDLRLCGRVTVARVEVADTPPVGFDAAQPVPAEELRRLQVAAGPGIEVTFGNDADAASALLFRTLGVTSVESYVAWQTVEDAVRGQFDWSRWDRQVDILQAAGLKWVPFLIAGPAYATPKWFREGPQHFPYVCLEHQQASQVESLWNPALRPEIERFLAAFAARYRDRGVIESVLLGITGIYGESIYPAGPEGGWTADVTGRYHNHAGWWAGDKLAVEGFRAELRRRYDTVGRLNAAWRTGYTEWSQVAPLLPDKLASAQARIDLAAWYEQTMTEWSRWWVATTRRLFPTTPIYLCTGGDGTPVLGADFSAQAKAIAPFGAGIRITNEGSHYVHNFAITREVATATRHYGTYCGFEPAGEVNADGVVGRAYNATASGARNLHYYTPNIVMDPAAVRNWRRVATEVTLRRIQPPRVAVYLPRAAWAVDPGLVGRTYEVVRALREFCDLDLVAPATVRDGILKRHRLLVVPTVAHLEADVAALLAPWVAAGGVLVQVDEAAGDQGLFVARPAGAPPARLRLLIGAAGDEPFLPGDWNGPERGGEFPDAQARKRWSGASPTVLLPLPVGQATTLEAEIVTPAFALAGATGEIRLGSQVLGRLREGHAVYRFAVRGEQVTAPVMRLTCDIRGWRPSERTGSSDRRLLGIAVSRLETGAGTAGEPVVNRGLALTLDGERLPLRTDGRGLRVTVPQVRPEQQALLWQALLAGVLPERGVAGLADDDAADGVFVTPLAKGRLWLNDSDRPVTKGGVMLPAHSLVETP